jgi:S1-C subfamily serine protease
MLILAPSVTSAVDNQEDTTKLDVPSFLMRSTFKIQGEVSPGKTLLGTTFIMGLPSKDDPKKLYYVLITAAHVLEGIKNDDAILYLRIKEGDEFKKLPYPIHIREKGTPLWVRHPDVDVAAMWVRLPNNADITLISTELLGTDKILKEFQVHPGDQLFVLGFPYGAESNEAGFPILRSGRISSYPLTPTEIYKTFLLDFGVFEGNSGGPVLFYSENRNYEGSPHFGSVQFIMGVVSQENEITEHIESLNETVTRKHNLSLAVIVQARFVSDLLKMLPPIPNDTP